MYAIVVNTHENKTMVTGLLCLFVFKDCVSLIFCTFFICLAFTIKNSFFWPVCIHLTNTNA